MSRLGQGHCTSGRGRARVQLRESHGASVHDLRCFQVLGVLALWTWARRRRSIELWKRRLQSRILVAWRSALDEMEYETEQRLIAIGASRHLRSWLKWARWRGTLRARRERVKQRQLHRSKAVRFLLWHSCWTRLLAARVFLNALAHAQTGVVLMQLRDNMLQHRAEDHRARVALLGALSAWSRRAFRSLHRDRVELAHVTRGRVFKRWRRRTVDSIRALNCATVAASWWSVASVRRSVRRWRHRACLKFEATEAERSAVAFRLERAVCKWKNVIGAWTMKRDTVDRAREFYDSRKTKRVLVLFLNEVRRTRDQRFDRAMMQAGRNLPPSYPQSHLVSSTSAKHTGGTGLIRLREVRRGRAAANRS